MQTESPRIGLAQVWPEAYGTISRLNQQVNESGVEPRLLELIKVRASQLNRCAFCLNMHWQDARKLGETEQRLALLDAWAEADCYTAAERAVLALTEAMTLLPQGGVSDAVVDAVREHFDEAQTARIMFAVVLINSWNRIAVADRLPLSLLAKLRAAH
jgi:AhpD family alkylhydroperoxidase